MACTCALFVEFQFKIPTLTRLCVVRIFLSSSTASQIYFLDLPIHGLLILKDYPEHPILNKRDGIEIAVCTGISI